MLEPLVSVLMPLHNAADFVDESIQNVLEQSYKNIELIIVDDGSTDTSYEIARKYEGSVVKILQTRNLGACHARNIALRHSYGTYIQYLDADDKMKPDKISNQVKLLLQNPRDAVASCSWKYFHSDDNMEQYPLYNSLLDRDWENPVDWLVNSWMGKGTSATAQWLVSRDVIEKAGPWNEKLLKNQDGEFFTRVLLKASRIAYCSTTNTYYRKANAESITSRITKEKVESQIDSIRIMSEEILKVEDSPRVREAIRHLYKAVIYHYQGVYPETLQMVWKEVPDLNRGNVTVGGKFFRVLADVIGFRAALKVKHLITNS